MVQRVQLWQYTTNLDCLVILTQPSGLIVNAALGKNDYLAFIIQLANWSASG